MSERVYLVVSKKRLKKPQINITCCVLDQIWWDSTWCGEKKQFDGKDTEHFSKFFFTQYNICLFSGYQCIKYRRANREASAYWHVHGCVWRHPSKFVTTSGKSEKECPGPPGFVPERDCVMESSTSSTMERHEMAFGCTHLALRKIGHRVIVSHYIVTSERSKSMSVERKRHFNWLARIAAIYVFGFEDFFPLTFCWRAVVVHLGSTSIDMNWVAHT